MFNHELLELNKKYQQLILNRKVNTQKSMQIKTAIYWGKFYKFIFYNDVSFWYI